MRTRFRTSFERDLRKVRDRQVLTRVAAAIREIEGAESLGDLRSVKPLVGSPGFYRIRIGDYRLGMLVEGEAVEIVRFLHRREVYRYFP